MSVRDEQMAQIAGVLFDKDGTLFDFNATWGNWTARVLTGLAAQGGVDRAHLAARVGYDFARGFAPQSPIIAGTVPEIAMILAGALPASDPADLVEYLNAQAAGAQVVEVVPLARFFADLRAAGYYLGVMTNDSEGSARAHLGAVAVHDLAGGGAWDLVIGADSGHGAKPGDQACRHALGRVRHDDRGDSQTLKGRQPRGPIGGQGHHNRAVGGQCNTRAAGEERFAINLFQQFVGAAHARGRTGGQNENFGDADFRRHIPLMP